MSAPVEPFSDDALPTFEDEALSEKSEPSSAPAKSSTKKGWQPFRSDGISNLSNKSRSRGLAIPAEFVGEELEVEEPIHAELRKEPRARIEETAPIQEEEAQEKPMSNLPWYLQSQHQTPVGRIESDRPMFERQALPDLPVHPPKHLDAILSHLSVEIGLDYLSILDLRQLDPPPALGNNLIMLVGTARGEKHLNVSAERFCAWLRREYKSNPYADGLLGRNELKIKQRRKAKKSRALANAGASAHSLEAMDDGIRTGWICVHAGYLDPHPDAPLKEVKRINGMVGFGEENNKVTLVVQMFTEEKREIVDIENLWTNILDRNLKKQAHQSRDVNDVDGEVAKASEEDQEAKLTPQELKARKRFKMGENTVLDNVHNWPPRDVQQERVSSGI